jgi:hypothetical protein
MDEIVHSIYLCTVEEEVTRIQKMNQKKRMRVKKRSSLLIEPEGLPAYKD